MPPFSPNYINSHFFINFYWKRYLKQHNLLDVLTYQIGAVLEWHETSATLLIILLRQNLMIRVALKGPLEHNSDALFCYLQTLGLALSTEDFFKNKATSKHKLSLRANRRL